MKGIDEGRGEGRKGTRGREEAKGGRKRGERGRGGEGQRGGVVCGAITRETWLGLWLIHVG